MKQNDVQLMKYRKLYNLIDYYRRNQIDNVKCASYCEQYLNLYNQLKERYHIRNNQNLRYAYNVVNDDDFQ